ncbi:MAG: glycine--tRNA ligase [Bdellovibrionales bacterium]|nr:glycine--tRNA ligase [Bdellovibrionales bacterium]
MLNNLNPLVSLCKRRGYIFPGSEIYGGLGACWDYGPLGAQFKINVKEHWWKAMTHRQDVVGLDSAILMHTNVWKASGHVDGFSDPLVDCKDCRFRFCLDKEKETKKDPGSCPQCGSKNLTKPRDFNLMFKTHAGSVEEEASLVYLRPETAQGIYVNFLNVQSSMRKKIPFGVAQIGKAFRNEITLGNFIFRCREFEQMEMQYFIHPKQADQHFEYWLQERKKFLTDLGLPEKSLRIHEHDKEELAHYARKAVDLEFLFPMGWKELEGIHHRGDFDLKQHQKLSGKKLSYFDVEKQDTYVPWVIETSIGLDRLILSLLCSAYKEEKVKNEQRIFLALHPQLAPIQVAVLPLSKKDQLNTLANKISTFLRKKWRIEQDETGSIGKRYRRQDEIGTPFCVTIDFDSLEDKKVTVRHRDTMKQERLDIELLERYFTDQYIN